MLYEVITLEFHGQFTEITSVEAFEDFDYGHYKDRAAGFRLVLWKESDLMPQLAFGAFDATGTALFAQRYLVASKRFGKVDFTLGFGQGTLAGEFGGREDSDAGNDIGTDFLFSSPFRKTRVFGGIEYDLSKNWTIAAEYSSIDRKNMFGYRDQYGEEVHDPGNDRWPINFGVKFHGENWQANLALLRGDTVAAGLQMAFPLKLNSLLGWRKTEKFEPGASLAYLAAVAENDQLAWLIAEQLAKEGFLGVKVFCSDTATRNNFV